MSFILICTNCGQEVEIPKGDIESYSFDKLYVYPTQGRAIIECFCGNESDIV